MQSSLSDQLTAQFYQWEKRGRGWQYFEEAVDLEPHFHPFFFHYAPSQAKQIDDGKRHTIFSRIIDTFTRKPAPEPQEDNYFEEDPEFQAHLFNCDEPIKVFSIALPKGHKIDPEATQQLLLMLSPRRSKREVWSYSTISELLKNTTYIGEAQWGKTTAIVPQNPKNLEKYRKMKKTSKKAKPLSEWIMVPVPAIIEKDLFNKVSEKLRDNFSFAKRNQKNNYLLTGKIFCPCGKRRSGQGRKNGTGLFYRCTDRLHSFPLPPTCLIKGVNTLTVDQLVWNAITKLMSSPDLMTEQINRLIDTGKTKAQTSTLDITILEKEIEKLKVQEDRFNQAYGTGLFTLEKLQEYVLPVREKVANLQSQILRNQGQNDEITTALPKHDEIQEFADIAIRTLKGLNFEARRAIVLNVVDKVIASREEVKIHGCIPINENVVLCTTDRNGK